MNSKKLIIGTLTAALLSGCCTTLTEWKTETVGKRAVERTTKDGLTTTHKYRIVGIKMDGADFGTYLLEPNELAAYLPGVFSASADALPVTVDLHRATFDNFSLLAVLGYFSTKTVTPCSLTVGGKYNASINFSHSLSMKLRCLPILIFFPYSDSETTEISSTTYFAPPENMPQEKLYANTQKAIAISVAAALQEMESTGLIAK